MPPAARQVGPLTIRMWSICHSLSYQLLWFSTRFSAQLPAPYLKAQVPYSSCVVKRQVERSGLATERLTVALFRYHSCLVLWAVVLLLARVPVLSDPARHKAPSPLWQESVLCCCLSTVPQDSPVLWLPFQTLERTTWLMAWSHFLVLGWYLFNSFVRVTLGMINTCGQSSVFDWKERLS